jgi:NADPH:quinone reductase-like Zn-dependent oxidoreductase
MTETMRAIRFHSYGGPEVLRLEDIPRPMPTGSQVLVRVHASSVNPIDWKLREGLLQAIMPLRLPATAGQDLAGIVEAVGADVSDLAPGTAVYAMSGTGELGAYAEHAVLDRSVLARAPAGLDFTTAAAVPMGALTAWQGVVAGGGLKAGDHLLVHAAAGNVGGMAVQLARALGAHVTGAAFAKDKALVEGWGAERFVAYDGGSFDDLKGQFDVVFDNLGGDVQAQSWELLRPGGILVSTLGIADPARAAAQGWRASGVRCVPNGDQLARIAALIEGGGVAPRIADVLPLDRAAEAQELNRTGRVKGKVVLQVA